MKKLIAIVALAASVAMTGCTDTIDTASTDRLDAAKPVLSQTEKDMLNVFAAPSFLSRYDNVYVEIVKNRVHFGQDPTPRSDAEVPFCDVIDSVIAAEREHGMLERDYTLSNQWKLKYGIPLVEQCNKSDRARIAMQIKLAKEEAEEIKDRVVIEEQEFSKKEIKAEKVIEESVVINEDVLLSPELVRDLRGSVKDCNRAKVKLMSVVDAGEPLTTKHYDEVKGLVLQCEMLKLEVEINK
ncbi:hypothetical protein vBValMR11Z_287 [Vibrio phage vB_ValM_R11Z]|nr:hypothetical protein vBValMR11Z_287 [Vibrio phage vB_ValM_R11Z]